MTIERALLDAILADPADDTVRLVYADWCDENDRGERAAFIRAQVELDRRPTCNRANVGGCSPPWCSVCRNFRPPSGKLMRQERQLLRAVHRHGGTPISNRVYWFVNLVMAATALQPTYTRGFVSRVRCTADDWIRYARLVLESHPVTTVALTTWPDVGGAFQQFPVHGDIRIVGTDMVLPGRALSRFRNPNGGYDIPAILRAMLAQRWAAIAFEFPGGD